MTGRPIIWKAANAVLITFRHETVPGLTTHASWNAASLVLRFDGKLGEHIGTMPVPPGRGLPVRIGREPQCRQTLQFEVSAHPVNSTGIFV
jgi:hypothetical protein